MTARTSAQKPRQLSPFQRRFVLRYAAHQNARLAYEEAGGSVRASYTDGPRTLRRPHVRAAVDAELAHIWDALRDRALAAAQITADRAEADPLEALDPAGNPLPLHLMPQRARRALKSMHVLYQDKERMRDDGVRILERVPLVADLTWFDSRPDRELALKLAGKLKEQVELGGPDGTPISVVFNLSPVRSE